MSVEERRTIHLSEDEAKNAVKEAMKEWLDEKFNDFYRWGMRGILATVLTGAVTIYLSTHWKV
jgi:hypothetical protein